MFTSFGRCGEFPSFFCFMICCMLLAGPYQVVPYMSFMSSCWQLVSFWQTLLSRAFLVCLAKWPQPCSHWHLVCSWQWLMLLPMLVLKGPVSVFLPFLERPRLGPVPESFRTQGPRTGTAKNRKKPVVTGRNRSCTEYIIIQSRLAKTGKNRTWLVKINCSLTFHVNFKLLIIKIGWELNNLCHISWKSKIWRAAFVVFTIFFYFSASFHPIWIKVISKFKEKSGLHIYWLGLVLNQSWPVLKLRF